LLQGPCNGGEDQSYTGSDFDSGCTGLSGCKKAVCDIDVAFHTAVFDETDALDTSVTCSAGSGGLTARDSCCGSSPFEYYTFNSADSTCGNTVTAQPTPVPVGPPPTGLFKYNNQDLYFAAELANGIPDSSTKNYGTNPISNAYDDNYSTDIQSRYSGSTGVNNHLFMYWSRVYSDPVYVKTVTIHGDRSHPGRHEFLEVRCIKSSNTVVCAKEGLYNYWGTITRSYILPFNCDDECTGLEVYNAGSGITSFAELDVEIVCPDGAAPDSENYCSVPTVASEPTGLLRYTDQDFYLADESSPGVPDVTTRNTGTYPLSNMYDDDYNTVIHSLYQNGQGKNNHLFMYYGSSEATKTIMLHLGRGHPDRAQGLEVRCLKSTPDTYSVCHKEEYYDTTAVYARDFALPFHCNDDCSGVEVHNSGVDNASMTYIAEFHVEIECSSVDSENYCI